MPISKLIWVASPFALLLCQALLPGAEMFYTNRMLVVQGVEVYSITLRATVSQCLTMTQCKKYTFYYDPMHTFITEARFPWYKNSHHGSLLAINLMSPSHWTRSWEEMHTIHCWHTPATSLQQQQHQCGQQGQWNCCRKPFWKTFRICKIGKTKKSISVQYLKVFFTEYSGRWKPFSGRMKGSLII